MGNVFLMMIGGVFHGSHTQHKSEAKQLSDKIKDVRIVMMTTIGLNGELHSRPMVAQDISAVEFDWRSSGP